MSPLPETELRQYIGGYDEKKFTEFINKEIDPEEAWEWDLRSMFRQDREKILKTLNADLSGGSHTEEIHDYENNQTTMIFPVFKRGMFLELQFDTIDNINPDTKWKLKNFRTCILHRVGENIVREYVDSITNG